MGINLREIIQAKEIELTYLSEKKVAIDAYNWIYQFLSMIRDRFTGEPLRDAQGKITSHLSGLFYRTARLLENNIKPIYVFDGEPPEFKKGIQAQRKKAREEAKIKWKEALKKGEKAITYAQAASKLTDEMAKESKDLLDAMGVAWVRAPSEGEAECAYLCKIGEVHFSASQDIDLLAFGSPRLIRNLNITGKRKLPRKESYVVIKPELIELDSVLSTLGINQDQLIIIGLLVGTDYNPGGIKLIGPKKALELVKKEKTLDKVLAKVKWEFDIPASKIFDFFSNPPVKDVSIETKTLDEDKIIEVLVDKHNFSEERVKNMIDKMKESEAKGKQARLESWFR